ncbi:MAG: hypothetical protein ACI81R_000871 [Bradymonadia bacterium]|jgi:hypothetical protein
MTHAAILLYALASLLVLTTGVCALALYRQPAMRQAANVNPSREDPLSGPVGAVRKAARGADLLD